jgi:hypothetical protein
MLAFINAATKALDKLGGGVVEEGGPSLGGRGGGDTWNFNVLHLRFENDWLAHCKRWVTGLLQLKAVCHGTDLCVLTYYITYYVIVFLCWIQGACVHLFRGGGCVCVCVLKLSVVA